ncbi:alanine--tRNA ligase, partial [Candidatus Microgenomates bacterium]|nr:alanine--tRNA ligase [Candidatus Microgenomates bacterium]
MTHLELRRKFLEFWKAHDHIEIPSSSLVPENDPTTLFTGSGMQPLIPYLLGQPHPLGKRLVNVQKCFRGQDVDEVGDNRHDSFFEMMGNWSLGDYFKKDQLAWYLEFLTRDLGFDKEKLYVSCFAGDKVVPKDTESAKIWKSLGIPDERIFYYDVSKNWWSRSGTPDEMPVGEIGGPNSEVFYEFSHIDHDKKFGTKCHPNCDCGRFIEIGNSVFITYQKMAPGQFKELPQKNVDFGGGMERTLAAVNNDPDIFKTDLYASGIETLEQFSDKKYGEEEKSTRVFRIIADHLKAAVFLIDAGVVASNKDRGYVLRRLTRRSVRFAKTIGIEKNFVGKVVEAVLETYKR